MACSEGNPSRGTSEICGIALNQKWIGLGGLNDEERKKDVALEKSRYKA